MRYSIKRLLIFPLMFLFFLVLNGNVNAANVTWLGTVNNDASDPANWSGGILPQNGGDVFFVSTSTDDCTWNITPSLASFNINDGYTGTVTLSSNLTITGDISILSGTFNAGSSIITVGGNWYFMETPGSPKGDINGDSIVDVSDAVLVLRIALEIDSIHPCSDINNDSVVDIADVILTLRMSYGIDPIQSCISGFGSFNPGTSTVIFSGTNQVIYGNTTFYNLTKTVSSADTLSFQTGSTQTIGNSLTLQGSSGGLISLRSTSPGNYWYIDPQGTRNISFADVQDSYNSDFVNIAAVDSVDSGSNVNWSFGGSECVCTENGLILVQLMGDYWRQPC